MKKTTLALAALIALTSGAAFAKTVKQDYQLNFFAQIEDGFSFERLDGKPWSEAIDIKHSALRDEFEVTTVKTRVILGAGKFADDKSLTAKIDSPSPKLVNKGDYTKEVGLLVYLNGKQLDTMGVKLMAKTEAENFMDLTIDPVVPVGVSAATGDYEGQFAITFEYGV
ncbi:CS1 type fimbrial major subunit [Photobacterium swingsii]|uniref:CS1 type fimbrial major subunit n=1 Tax=Photobacterium swingsii TaxID=680026 RepID=UPI00354F3586